MLIADCSLGAVIVAAGAGTRFGDADKVFVRLGDKPILAYSLALFAMIPMVTDIVLVLGEHTIDRGRALLEDLGSERAHICLGGETRAMSVRAGLDSLSEDVRLVAVHDAARPLASVDLVERVLSAARSVGAAIPGTPIRDTVHQIGAGSRVSGTLDRSAMRAAQTPQIARRDWLEEAFRSGDAVTDEAGLLQAAGFPVAVVDGAPTNLKITWPEDLIFAEAILAARAGSP